MDRMDSFGATRHAEPADPTAETIINGVPYVPRVGSQTHIDQPEGGLSEEIKRRQIALTVRYIAVLGSVTR